MKGKKLLFLSFSLPKFRKYLPKQTNKIHLHDYTSEVLPSLYKNLKNLKKCKYTKELFTLDQQNPSRLCKKSKLCNIILYLIKCFKRCLQFLPLLINKNSHYKYLYSLKSLKIVDNNWSDWRATRYNTHIKCLIISDVEQSESSLKVNIPCKEKYFRRFLQTQRRLESISFKVALKLEYYRYLTILEEKISSLGSLKAINLDFKFQVSGLSISRHRLPHLFRYIRTFKISEPPLYFLRLCNSGSELESFTGEWLQDPKALRNLREVTIKMRNDLPANWKLFHSLQALECLESFNLSLHKPNVLTLMSIMNSIVLPQTLRSFSLKLYSFDLSQTVKEDEWPERNPFEISSFFKNLLVCIEKSENLKKLKIHLTYTNYKAYYTGLVISLCQRAKNLNELKVKIQEIFPINGFFLPEYFHLGKLYLQTPEIWRKLSRISIAVPHICMQGIPERALKMNNLLLIKILGNIDGQENQRLINLLKATDPQNIVIKGQILETESQIESFLTLLSKMKRLQRLDLEFRTSFINKKEIMVILNEKLRHDIQVSIVFGALGEYSRELFETYVKMCGKGRCNPLLTIRGGQIQFTQETYENWKRVFYVNT